MAADSPRLRTMLDRLPAYAAGRPPSARADLTPFKLSSNENPPRPAAGRARRHRRGRGADRTATPTRPSTALVARWPSGSDVPARAPRRSGTGSVRSAASRSCRSPPTRATRSLYAWRSFEAYPIWTQIAGATRVQVPLDRATSHDLDAMADAITDRTRLRLRLHAEQPDRHRRAPGRPRPLPRPGARRRARGRRRGLRRVRPRPRRRATASTPTASASNVAVLRTFSKAYGLAGLRVGFAVAHPRVALGACARPRSPSASRPIAQAAAIASLDAEDELLERVEAIVAERDRVDGRRSPAQGWTVPPSQANFVWLPLGDASADFVDACDEREPRRCAATRTTGCASRSASPRPTTGFLVDAAASASGRSSRSPLTTSAPRPR